MRSLLVALVLSAASSYSSCDPVMLEHPLSDPAQAKPDARLPGVWTGYVGDSKSVLHFVGRNDGQLDVVLVTTVAGDKPPVLTYQALCSTAGGHSYLGLREKTWTEPMEDKHALSSSYVLVRTEFDAQGALTVSYLPNEAVEAAVKAGTLHADARAHHALSDEPAAVLRFLAKPEAQAAFKPLGTFKKAQLDFGKPPPEKKP
jgi:hypothetical protein